MIFGCTRLKFQFLFTILLRIIWIAAFSVQLNDTKNGSKPLNESKKKLWQLSGQSNNLGINLEVYKARNLIFLVFFAHRKADSFISDPIPECER